MRYCGPGKGRSASIAAAGFSAGIKKAGEARLVRLWKGLSRSLSLDQRFPASGVEETQQSACHEPDRGGKRYYRTTALVSSWLDIEAIQQTQGIGQTRFGKRQQISIAAKAIVCIFANPRTASPQTEFERAGWRIATDSGKRIQRRSNA
ncbi:hypothetical protein A1507_18350 [Methylomonas koyamae]|uniref:Uncharacterized protein n=1 Tax=Methylomonas koyamae TaxID=702114 RepID=A0A177N5Z7_9GAMM|nr:hypothetical protein A1507_18350 [Methylomonas koyamae]